MPTTKSAEKRQRQATAATALNKSKKSRITSARRDLEETLQAGDLEKARAACRTFFSALDKGAKAGVIKANKADRSKARAAKALTKASA